MVDSKGNSVRYLDVLRRVLLIFGCLIFLNSIILPFVYVYHSNLSRSYSQTCWSYKETYRLTYYEQYSESWFFDYWTFVHIQSTYTLWLLLLMFAAQTLTLATGIASILIHKRNLALAPAILSTAVTVLMTFASSSFSGRVSYEQGYWFTYPSILLFIAAFTLSLLSNKKKTDLQASKN